MAKYVDGFVIPLPRKNLKSYRKMAGITAKFWMDHGALSYVECVGEDLKVPFGMPFPERCACKPGETVVFAWITYKSRAHRDRVNKKVMADPRLKALGESMQMPFDPKRMAWGGFDVIVER